MAPVYYLKMKFKRKKFSLPLELRPEVGFSSNRKVECSGEYGASVLTNRLSPLLVHCCKPQLHAGFARCKTFTSILFHLYLFLIHCKHNHTAYIVVKH